MRIAEIMQLKNIKPAWFFTVQAKKAVRLWSGLGEKVYLGNTYSGDSNLGLVEAFTASINLVASRAKIKISAVNPHLNATLLARAGARAEAQLALCLLDANNSLIAGTEVQFFSGYLEQVEIQPTEKNYQLIAHLADAFFLMNRDLTSSYYEDSSQKEIDPTDTGLEEVSQVAQEIANWNTVA